MPATKVKSRWASGDLIFYEGDVSRGAIGNILTIGDDAVTVGSATNDIDLKVFLGSASNYALFDVGNKLLSVVKSSAEITGAIRTVEITQTMTAAATANQVEVLKVELIADVKTGAWAQAIFAKTDYSTNGLAHGAGSVVCAELSLPASSVVRGTYYVWQSEIDCPTNCVMNANPIAVMSVSVWGGAKTQFDDVGLLFDIAGITSGAAKFFYDHTDGAYDGWLKCRIDGDTYYIPLMDGQAA